MDGSPLIIIVRRLFQRPSAGGTPVTALIRPKPFVKLSGVLWGRKMCTGLDARWCCAPGDCRGGSNIGCRFWCECAAVLGGRKILHATNAKPLDPREIQGALCYSVWRRGGDLNPFLSGFSASQCVPFCDLARAQRGDSWLCSTVFSTRSLPAGKLRRPATLKE